jgi:hypothetical protein
MDVEGVLTAVASTARSLTGTPDIRVGFTSANHADLGIALTVRRADIYSELSAGILTVTSGDVKIGVDGINFNIIDGNIGIGTTQATTSKVVIFDEDDARLEIITHSNYAAINLGGDAGIGASTVELRYEDQRLELSNYGTEDFIYHLGKNAAAPNGNYRWGVADPLNELMTLTTDGRLGLGNTNPPSTLYVQGGATINGVTTITGKVDIDDDVHVSGQLLFNNASGIATAYDLDVDNDLNVAGTLVVGTDIVLPDVVINLNNVTGVSTFNEVIIQSGLTLQGGGFNYETVSGITTVNDLNIGGNTTIGGGLTVTGSIDFSSATIEALADFNTDLSVLGNFSVGGATTVTQFECESSSGICTFNDVDINGSASVGSIIISTEGIYAEIGITTVGELNIINQSTPITFSEDQNFNTTSGISTFRDLRVEGDLIVPAGIPVEEINNNLVVAGIVTLGAGLTVYDGADEIGPNLIGVSTGLEFYNYANIGMGIIGTARAAIDVGNRTDYKGFILPPVLTTTQRVGLDTVAGAFIFNSSTGKHQGYDGTTWNDFY